MSGTEPRFHGEVSERSHKNMSHIKGKDTAIEIMLRKALWAKGYRFRKNYKELPGRPDIAITKFIIAIFCDSEFFHGKDWINLILRSKLVKNQIIGLRRLKGTLSEIEKKTLCFVLWVGL